MIINRRWTRRWLQLALAWLISQAAFAGFLEDAHSLDLPAQPLSQALRALAVQTNAQIYYDDQTLLDRNRTAPLQGRYALAVALDRLLSGTPWRYDVVDGVIMVMRASPAAAIPAARTRERTRPRAPAAVGLDEVVVTASKRAESIQETPISATVFAAGDIDAERFQRLADIDGSVPNLSISLGQTGGNSALQAFIRGVGETDYLITTDPAVGLYIDGVYIARTTGANVGLIDVERIEVLRGPQGTLFGKNAIAGAISIATRQPGWSPQAALEASYGSRNLIELRGSGDWPLLDDRLALRVAVMSREADGWQQRPGRDGGAERKRAARAGLRWHPADRFESLLVLDGSTQDQPSYANTVLRFNPAAPVAVAYRDADLTPPCCELNSPYSSGGTSPLARDNSHAFSATWTNTWSPDEQLTVRSISGYRDSDAEFGQDYDHSAAAYYAFGDITQHWQFSQELQLIGEAEAVHWVAGLYHFEESGSDESTLEVVPAAVAAGEPIADLNLRSHTQQATRSQALFAQFEYNLTERWTLGLGARYTYEKKRYRKRGIRSITGQPQLPPSKQPASAECTVTGSTAGSPFRCEGDWEAFTPKLELSYRWSDALFLYGLAASGFRSGGFNGRPTSLSLIESYDPEYLESVELGFKLENSDRRLRLNGAAFVNNYRDKQQTVNIADPTTGSMFLTVNNAGRARIQGFELEATALLSDRFKARAGLGFTDARFLRWDDALMGDLSDRKFPYAPRWNGDVSLIYQGPGSDLGSFSGEVNLDFKDDFHLDPENSRYLHASAYSTVNASLGWRSLEEQWEIILAGKNLTNRQALASGFDGSNFFGVVHANYIAPRQWWLTLRYRVN